MNLSYLPEDLIEYTLYFLQGFDLIKLRAICS